MKRRGLGVVFVVVAALLVIVLCYGVVVAVRGRGVTRSLRRSIFTDRCEDLARMAATEALHRLRRESSTSETPGFQMLRDRGPGARWDAPLAALPQLSVELGAEPGYSLREPVRVDVLRWLPLAALAAEASPFEVVGLLRLACSVDGPAGSFARLAQEYGFRAQLTAPPAPFDRLTFLLVDTDALMSVGARDGDPNATIQWAIDGLRICHEQLVKAAQLVEPTDAGAASRLRAAAASPAWPARAWRTVPFGEAEPAADAPVVHAFELPLSVYSYAPELDLARVDLPSRVGPLVVRGSALAVKLQAEVAGLSGLGAAAVDRLDAVVRLAHDLVRTMDSLLAVYREFQDALVEIVGPGRAWMLERARRMSLEEQGGKADARFEGPGAAARAAAFLARQPVPVGLVYVDDPLAPLTVDLPQVEGRLVVVTRGSMVVRAARPRSPERDVLVLASHGALEVAAPVEASLTAWGDDYRNGHDLRGTLLLRTLRPGCPFGQALTGRLVRQEAVQAGATPAQPRPEVVTVTLSPAPLWQHVDYAP